MIENTENTENRQDNPVTTEEKKELPSRASRGKRYQCFFFQY